MSSCSCFILYSFGYFNFIKTAFTTPLKGRKETKLTGKSCGMARTTKLGSKLSVILSIFNALFFNSCIIVFISVCYCNCDLQLLLALGSLAPILLLVFCLGNHKLLFVALEGVLSVLLYFRVLFWFVSMNSRNYFVSILFAFHFVFVFTFTISIDNVAVVIIITTIVILPQPSHNIRDRGRGGAGSAIALPLF